MVGNRLRKEPRQAVVGYRLTLPVEVSGVGAARGGECSARAGKRRARTPPT